MVTKLIDVIDKRQYADSGMIYYYGLRNFSPFDFVTVLVTGGLMTANDKGQKLVKVYSTQGQLRAAVIRSALESAGIPVMLRFESIGSTLGITIDGLGRVDVLVPAEWENEAVDLLNAESDDKCAQDDES